MYDLTEPRQQLKTSSCTRNKSFAGSSLPAETKSLRTDGPTDQRTDINSYRVVSHVSIRGCVRPSVRRSVGWSVTSFFGGQRRAGERLISCTRTCLIISWFSNKREEQFFGRSWKYGFYLCKISRPIGQRLRYVTLWESIVAALYRALSRWLFRLYCHRAFSWKNSKYSFCWSGNSSV